MSNFALEQACQSLDVPFIRAKVGDRYVIEQLKANDWALGGESSGHIINRDFHTTGDGILAGLQVLAAMVAEDSDIETLLDGFKKLPQTLVNVRYPSGADPLNSPQVKAVVAEVETALAGKGRVLLRKSGTEPVIRVMVEGADTRAVKTFAQQIAQEVEAATK